MSNAAAAPENSFIANASFTRAPLNSRVPPVSPHRLAGKRKEKPRSSSAAALGAHSQAQARKPSQVRASDRYGDEEDEEDEVPDSGSVIEEEEVDEETRVKQDKLRRRQLGLEKEPLEGLSAELQEALISEDLLYVLTVSSGARSRLGSRRDADPFGDLRRVSKVATSSSTRPTHRRMTMNVCKARNSSSTRSSVRARARALLCRDTTPLRCLRRPSSFAQIPVSLVSSSASSLSRPITRRSRLSSRSTRCSNMAR